MVAPNLKAWRSIPHGYSECFPRSAFVTRRRTSVSCRISWFFFHIQISKINTSVLESDLSIFVS